jgi:hypothetical protein
MANPNWVAGVSGNPKGRPPKGRALTEILKATLDKKVRAPNAQRARIRAKTQLAEMAVEGLISGVITFSNGKTLKLTSQDWKDMLKWMYTHVDGGAVVRQEISGPKEGVAFDYDDAIAKVALQPERDSAVSNSNGGSGSRQKVGEDGYGGSGLSDGS